uniref:tissue factor pathway inhibitor 2-like n=1 Tax=Monopterus albus TaxID=43700 RepID=UPI0009B3C796|nr:tissue factor pathway inhibitor 2-like [Monopterus albus]
MSQHISAPTFPLGNASLSYKIGSGWDGQQSRKDRWSGSKSCTMEFCTLKLFTVLFSFYSVLALPQWLPPTGNRAACLLQVDDGPCRAAIERYYYNTFTQKCEIFYYGGCKGNANNFNSYQECQKSCFRFPKIPQICRYPRDVGPCRARFPSYFFNMATMQCEPFYYGGCQGNPNRFKDPTSCVEYCSPRKR